MPTPTTPLWVDNSSLSATAGRSAPNGASEQGEVSNPAQHLRDSLEQRRYDVVARFTVMSHRDVVLEAMAAEGLTDLTLITARVVETYRGELGENVVLFTLTDVPNSYLSVNGEYVSLLHKYFVDNADGQRPDEPARHAADQAMLDELGGEAFAYHGRELWAVEGSNAFRVPVEFVIGAPTGQTALDAAKVEGDAMTLEALERLLRPDTQ